ncbi:MAG: head GIN domain-containing protein [Dysgonomonas sp.]|nr:head GIN domain-containing protein [Dysgonomonas sp.]
MKASLKVLLSITIISLFFISCKEKTVQGDGNVIRHEIEVDIYNEIKVSGAIDVVYEAKPDEAAFLEVEADDNIIPLIDIKVKGRTLHIQARESINPSRFIVYTNSPSLKYIETKGASKIKMLGAVAGDEFKLDLKGTGDFVAENLVFEKAEFKLNGSANMEVAGQVDKAKFEIAGNGNIKATDLSINDVECKIKGNGDLEVHAIEKMSIDISGRGNLSYKGNPQIKKQKIKGAGTVKVLQ